ncbi:MAG: GPP34 family phosphoprotein [Catenulisporales bacterium]|nr:GPP34 family phosphoprotein [Catenulisporales bacterium]
MDTLGEDLALLALRPKDGRVGTAKLGYGLMGSELVRLAAAGRVDIVRDRIVVSDSSPTGDAELDAALASMVAARKPPRPKSWVGSPRRHLDRAYFARLTTSGTLCEVRGKVLGLFPVSSWQVLDPERVAQARARFDAVARSSGSVDAEQAAFGGLGHAIGLGELVYPGRGNKDLRKRLQQIAKGEWSARAVGSAIAAVQAATDAAVSAAVDAAVHAAVDGAGAHGHSGDGGGGGGHGGH